MNIRKILYFPLRFLVSTTPGEPGFSVGLLLFRLMLGIGMMTHGAGKFMNFQEAKESFFDPLAYLTGGSLQMGSELAIIMAMSAEFGCSLILLFGVLTRLTLIPLIFTMGVAVFLAHAGDPFAKREPALMYLSGYVMLLLLGPGRISVDYLFFRRWFSKDVTAS